MLRINAFQSYTYSHKTGTTLGEQFAKSSVNEPNFLTCFDIRDGFLHQNAKCRRDTSNNQTKYIPRCLSTI